MDFAFWNIISRRGFAAVLAIIGAGTRFLWLFSFPAINHRITSFAGLLLTCVGKSESLLGYTMLAPIPFFKCILAIGDRLNGPLYNTILTMRVSFVEPKELLRLMNISHKCVHF
jgi:hypothetical protein